MVAGLALSAPVRLRFVPRRSRGGEGRRLPVFQRGRPMGVSRIGLSWMKPVRIVLITGPSAGAELWPGSVCRHHI